MADPTDFTAPPGIMPARPAPGFQPYVSPDLAPAEFTLRAVLVGSLLGILFGASSLYLVLRVGMTVSASIPVAVLSITLFRALSRAFRFRNATILENNITQTAGSAGESIAFGVGVTMPALLILGFDMDLSRVMVVSVLGGLLGILMMIPLRRAFIVQMHDDGTKPKEDTLLYPEGTACAEVLISGEKGGAGGATVFLGFGVAFVVNFLVQGMSLLAGMLVLPLRFFNRVAKISSEVAPELVGVGYIIGLRIAAIMMAGAVIGNLVIVPTIAQFTDPGAGVKDMDFLKSIQGNYLRYIGAGCVTAAGILSMFKTLPLIFGSFGRSLGKLGGPVATGGQARTDRDLPAPLVGLGSLALLAGLAVFLAYMLYADQVPGAWWKAVLGAGLVLLFGFLFVTVSSRLTGEIGSSSNPISGMTVATLALTCLIFLSLGMTSPAESVIALSVGAVVCIAASNGGTTSQDLKTGFLVGGTPIYMQLAILIGALSSALVIGSILLVFNEAGTVHTRKNLPAYTLTADDYARLTRTATYEGAEYKVWWPRAGDPSGVKPGKYYIDSQRRIAVLEDPAITGRITERDDGSEVKMKFEAPKTEVIGIIINGVLEQKLNWALILIGASLAVGLELCGVSSLAFAVGVYIPMQYTTPIFLGGIVRWIVDARTAPPPVKEATAGKTDAREDAKELAKSETGPGVLLASGYIAGGTIAGVLIAFLELPFFKTAKDAIDLTRKSGGKAIGPLLEFPREGIDWLPLPLLLLLALFLVYVGSGLLFKQTKTD